MDLEHVKMVVRMRARFEEDRVPYFFAEGMEDHANHSQGRMDAFNEVLKLIEQEWWGD